MMKHLSIQPVIIKLIALLLLGTVLLWPFITLQGFISTGDHGRELYAFAHIFDGKQSQVPYQDYWWMYGPLMLYYYGFFMKIFGANVLSVLIAKTLLLLLTGTFIGLTVMAISQPIAGLAAAAWFWITFFNFYHTHNHTGGLACIAAWSFFLISYIKTSQKKFLWFTLITLCLLALIKLNIGIVVLLTTIISIFLAGLYDRKPFASGNAFFWWGALCAVPLIITSIYALFLHGLSMAEIRECFPFGTTDRQYAKTPWQTILLLATAFIKKLPTSWTDQVMAVIVLIAIGWLGWRIFKKSLDAGRLRVLLLSLVTLGLLFIALLHEYLFSGVGYCLYWAQPTWMLIMFIMLAFASKELGLFWKTLLWSIICAMLIYLFGYKYISSTLDRSPESLFRHPNVQVFVKNDYSWLFTVGITTSILEKNLQPEETFFAFPYDPLYYYLTNRLSPTWQTCFFSYQHIPPEQEQKTIADLEKKHVNWVVASNRVVSSEAGLGILGRDYCPLIAKYLEQNFSTVLIIGDWKHPAGWAWNYGTMILKRKPR